MRDLIKIGIVLATIVALMVIGFSTVARKADDTSRRIRSEAIEVQAERTDRRLQVYALRTQQDSTRIAWLESDIMRLEEEADAAQGRISCEKL